MSQLLTLHNPSTARQYYERGIWKNDTLYSLAREHARDRGDAFAVRDNVRRLTWRELLAWADAVAADLHEAGLRPGERISIWLPNRVETVVVFLACSRNGYVCNPSLHQNYTVDEVMTLLARIDCRALFAQPGYGADAKKADIFARLREQGGSKSVYALAPLTDPKSPLPARPMPMADRAGSPAECNGDPDKVVYLAFTSGTTGTPKGVMHSDNTLLANGRVLARDWGQDSSTVLFTLSPMSHHIATVALEQMLAVGCELVMNDPVFGVSTLDWVKETGATYLMGVPTHAMDLLHELDRRGGKSLGTARVFYMAGAPIPTETARRLLELGVTPQNVYGMTESGSHQYTLPTDAISVITATCGKSCAAYEIRLWNAENPDLEITGTGEVGEIGGRGGELMLGYFGNQPATEGSFNREGWFLSGDLGRFDAAGNLRIVGRKKDLIIRGGHNIHPAHIEEYAHRHPSVKKAAAFGVPDERLGEKVCLALVCEGAEPSAEEILLHLAREGLSKFDMPEYLLFPREFPLTASGKILKRELTQWVATGKARPQPVRYREAAQT